MTNLFKDILKSEEFREEYFVAEFQSRLSGMLDRKCITRAELARKLGVSRARVTQILSDEAKDFSIRLLYRSFLAVGEEPVIISKSEYDELKGKATARADAKSPRSVVEQGEAGMAAGLIADLLRANLPTVELEQGKPGKSGDEARKWAQAGPNVIPIRERSHG